MRYRFAGISCASVLFLFLFGGCEKSSNMATQPAQSNPVAQQDQVVLGGIIAQDPLFTTDASALTDDSPSLSKTDTLMMSRGWGRTIENSTRSVTYNQVNDSTVIATVTNSLTGQVWIRVHRTSTDTILYKPLSESIVHRVEFMKVPIPNFNQLTNWKMVAVSGTQGGTNNAGITIQHVMLLIGGDTIQVASPLDSLFQFSSKSMHRHWGMREFIEDASEPFKVMVTVRSSDPDSDIVTAHRPMMFNFSGRYRRASMDLVSSVPNGDGTFTRVYENSWSGSFAGRFNVFVSALTRQSVYDSQAPFASQVWGIPFIIDVN